MSNTENTLSKPKSSTQQADHRLNYVQAWACKRLETLKILESAIA